jgi:ectoine hydroxylase-related dioxygenase (phytanoyl-CoA dioxygenase family)
MRLTIDELRKYEEDGFVLAKNCFSEAEVQILYRQLPSVLMEDSPRRVMEENTVSVRSVYGSHRNNEVFERLSRHPRLVIPAMQIVDSEVYVYQFKVNAKSAFGGDVWDWHQDYIFWQKEDGMLAPRVMNAVIFLDEVNEFNGPMFFIPGSHKEGVFDVPASDGRAPGSGAYRNSPPWITNLTAKLKYSLARERVAALVKKYGMSAGKGPRGSVLFFNANLVHGSPNNISPFDRAVIIVTYNSVKNVPVAVERPRPDFLTNPDHGAIVPLNDNALLYV